MATAIGSNAISLDGSQKEALQRMCGVCAKVLSKYTCPRCNGPSCSLACYQRHSSTCTEAFYKTNLDEALKGRRAEEGSREKILESLQRVYGPDDVLHMDTSDIDQEDDRLELLSAATLERLALKPLEEVCLDDLTAAELARFQAAASGGELGHLVQPWEPWWFSPQIVGLQLRPDGTKLIQELADESSSPQAEKEDEHQESVPHSLVPDPPDAALAKMKELLSTEPSVHLRWHLLDVLFSYCVSLRIFNGDWSSDPYEAANVLVGTSAVLSAGASSSKRSGQQDSSPTTDLPCSAKAALRGAMARALAPGGCLHSWGDGQGALRATLFLHDVATLIAHGRPAVVCSLADMQRMISAACADKKGMDVTLLQGQRKKAKQSLKRTIHKIMFLTSWANEQSGDIYDELSAFAEDEHSRQRQMAAVRDERACTDGNPNKGGVSLGIAEAQHDTASRPPRNMFLVPGGGKDSVSITLLN